MARALLRELGDQARPCAWSANARSSTQRAPTRRNCEALTPQSAAQREWNVTAAWPQPYGAQRSHGQMGHGWVAPVTAQRALKRRLTAARTRRLSGPHHSRLSTAPRAFRNATVRATITVQSNTASYIELPPHYIENCRFLRVRGYLIPLFKSTASAYGRPATAPGSKLPGPHWKTAGKWRPPSVG